MADAELKRILKQLGETISETLAESPKINEHLQEIRDAGYELMLTIEAKVGSSLKNSKQADTAADYTGEPVQLQITPEDAKFLKSLKISSE
jgi:transaldolase